MASVLWLNSDRLALVVAAVGVDCLATAEAVAAMGDGAVVIVLIFVIVNSGGISVVVVVVGVDMLVLLH